MSSPKRIVLAYSGGLDTSVILRWLIDTYQCEVVAFCADLGQGEELAPVEEKAKKVGASKIFITDLREEFVRDFVFPMLRANAFYEGGYLLHIRYEGGILEDPWREPSEDMFVLSVSPERAPDKPEYVEIDFTAGNLSAVNGERLTPAALLAKLNALGGRHGIGRLDLVEN